MLLVSICDFTLRPSSTMNSSWKKLALILCIICVGRVSAHPRQTHRQRDSDGYHPEPAPLNDYVDYPGIKIDWYENAQERLRATLARDPNMNAAKNVILFVGDGMGVSTVTAARIYRAQTHNRKGEDALLSWEKMPHSALSITNNVDYQVPDSAATATAMLTGIKSNYYTLGVSEDVMFQNCTMMETGKLRSALKYAMEKDKWTGVVTTTRITHATPAASYAHSPDRNWESNVADDAPASELCRDIAYQMIRDEENKNIRVILGGGRKHFLPNTTADPEPDFFPNVTGSRPDSLDLIQEWQDIKAEAGLGPEEYQFVKNKAEFDAVNVDDTEYLLGLFNPDHLDYEVDRLERSPPREPSLVEMVEKAINILKKSDNGFFLLAEGGRIDHAHHDNNAHRSLNETSVLSDAVEKALEMTDEEDTLVVVTADHSHVFTMGGYNIINNPILGLSNDQGYDGKPFTTLSYGNGPGFFEHRWPDQDHPETPRRDLTGEDTTGVNYLQDATVPLQWETHGGEEVAIYANGPMSHLIDGVVEQNYIGHVMMYASCIGLNKDHCEQPVRYPLCPGTSAAAPLRFMVSSFTGVMLLVLHTTLEHVERGSQRIV